VGLGESLVLLYLLLASGDLFLQKLVRVMPTLRDKKRAVDISHEIQQQISNYLFSVSLINLGPWARSWAAASTGWGCPTPQCGAC
jgi:predicted PurR-regulated permease PerM